MGPKQNQKQWSAETCEKGRVPKQHREKEEPKKREQSET